MLQGNDELRCLECLGDSVCVGILINVVSVHQEEQLEIYRMTPRFLLENGLGDPVSIDTPPHRVDRSGGKRMILQGSEVLDRVTCVWQSTTLPGKSGPGPSRIRPGAYLPAVNADVAGHC